MTVQGQWGCGSIGSWTDWVVDRLGRNKNDVARD